MRTTYLFKKFNYFFKNNVKGQTKIHLLIE